MYWKRFNQINKTIVFFSTCLLFACTSNENSESKEKTESEFTKTELTREEEIIRKVENRLNIPATEKYDIQIIDKLINPDTLMDALILVNRKEYALKKAKETNTERFFTSTGSTGLYNYVFLKLGGKDQLITTNPVGSNAHYPLTSTFMELTSKAHKDFFVDYRVRNSLYRNFYTVRNDRLFLTFSCPVFDSIGVEKPRVYDIQFPKSEARIAKDIALYEGQIVDYNPNEIEDVNNYTPNKIIRNGELYVYFIFDDKKMKYVTPMAAK